MLIIRKIRGWHTYFRKTPVSTHLGAYKVVTQSCMPIQDFYIHYIHLYAEQHIIFINQKLNANKNAKKL